MTQISDEKIKAIASEYLTNGMVKTKALQSIGYTKNYAEHGGLKLFDNVRLKEEIARQQALLSEKSMISLIRSQLQLQAIADENQHTHPAAAFSAIATLLKTIPNAFKAEQPNPDNLRAKSLSIQSIAEIRKLAELQHKLQGRPVESLIDSLPVVEAITEQAAEFVVKEKPHTPQGAGMS